MIEAGKTKEAILIVDDDKFLAEMYGMKFTAEGYDVRVCLSTADALGVLRGGFRADCILFDLVMPEQDGFAFIRAVSGERLVPEATVIALTNQATDSEQVKAREMGVERYIVKASMIPSEVVEAVKEELGKRPGAAPAEGAPNAD